MVAVAKTFEDLESGNYGEVALRTFFNIAEAWKLSKDQMITLLGNPSHGTFYNWKSNPPKNIHRDTLERISYILGIYKAIRILLPHEESAHKWPSKSNKAFNGKSALDLMLQGRVADLASMRQYLDAERGAHD